MLSLRRSPARSSNRSLTAAPRRSLTNSAYVDKHSPSDEASTAIVLLGGKSPVDFRVRVAQAHARDDMAPSAWSHIGVLGARTKNPLRRSLIELPLQGRVGLGYPPATNGVIKTPIGEYDEPAAFPNIAVLRVPVPHAAVDAAITEFCLQRTVMDALELTLAWLAFAWGVGTTGNPLLAGLGVPSAAFVEYVVGAAGYDLVPGFPSRSSCPEAIWQSARWWHEFPRAASVELSADSKEPVHLAPVSGVYDAEHYLVDPPAAKQKRRR
jgi:hypothetical protein